MAEILLRDGGHAGLDAIDSDFIQLFGDRDFVGYAEDHARRLFAVGRVAS